MVTIKKICTLGTFTLCFACLATSKSTKKTDHKSSSKKVETPAIKEQSKTKTAQPKDRTITVNNKIDKKMTGYKYILKTYYPEVFKIIINDKEIDLGTDAKIAMKDNKLFVRYIYNFPPYKKGTKEVELNVEPNAENVEITFSWKNDWRIIPSNASPVTVKEISA